MQLTTELYEVQAVRWPSRGRHILAQYTDDTVVVYQAYRPEIGQFAATHNYFGGEFGLNRMSWIKPNFLWMMYRCGWGTKSDQETVLAIWLKRSAFNEILGQAVPSTFSADLFETQAEWEKAIKASDVRLQWDPDHDPNGRPLERRAIQLGLRGSILKQYSKEWIVEIEDISAFAREQNLRRSSGLMSPVENVYPLTRELKNRIGAS